MKNLSQSQAKGILPPFLQKNVGKTPSLVQYINKYSVSDKYVYAVPEITNNDFKQTLNKYRIYRDQYKLHAIKENKKIKIYNEKVLEYHSKNGLSISDFHFIKDFQKENRQSTIEQYNKEVELENSSDDELLLLKKLLVPLKKQHESSFKTLIGFYTSQINKKTSFLKANNKPTRRLLEKLVINYCHWANHHIDGVKSETATVRTLQNHVYRLRDAGVIKNYQFLGSKSAVYCEINSQILAISDQINSKSQNSQNQTLRCKQRQKVHNNNIPLISSSNKKIIKKNNKDFVNNLPFKKGNQNLQEHHSCNVPKNNDAFKTKEKSCVKKEKIIPQQNISEYLLDDLKNRNQLAKELEHKTVNYKAIDEKILAYESNYGTTSKEEFSKIIIQQIILNLYLKIYKDHKLTFYTGVWINAIKSLEDRFINKGFQYKKQVMLLTFKKWKIAIDMADKWFIKNNFRDVLDPFRYLDKNRTHNNQVGLQFILNKVHNYEKNNEKAKEKYRINKLNLKKEANHTQNNNKLVRAISKYKKGIYTYDQLYNYVNNVIPIYLKYLDKHIKNY